MAKASRDKGARRERQVVVLHTDMDVKAERVPLSGTTIYRGNGAGVDVYALGPAAIKFEPLETADLVLGAYPLWIPPLERPEWVERSTGPLPDDSVETRRPSERAQLPGKTSGGLLREATSQEVPRLR